MMDNKNKNKKITPSSYNHKRNDMFMRSPGSAKSVDSQRSKNKGIANNRPTSGRKAPSVYDSDTESSKMRRQTNNRVSPYRQGTNPSNSAKKKYEPKKGGKFNNISNLNNANVNNRSNRSRSRSQSKSVRRKEASPPQSSNI